MTTIAQGRIQNELDRKLDAAIESAKVATSNIIEANVRDMVMLDAVADMQRDIEADEKIAKQDAERRG